MMNIRKWRRKPIKSKRKGRSKRSNKIRMRKTRKKPIEKTRKAS